MQIGIRHLADLTAGPVPEMKKKVFHSRYYNQHLNLNSDPTALSGVSGRCHSVNISLL